MLRVTMLVATLGMPCAAQPQTPGAFLSVAEFLPDGYVRDGSVDYRIALQKAIDAAAQQGRPLIFPAMTYRVDEEGLELRSNLTLWMYGALFRLDEKRQKDGAVFRGEGVEQLTLLGGSIVGD